MNPNQYGQYPLPNNQFYPNPQQFAQVPQQMMYQQQQPQFYPPQQFQNQFAPMPINYPQQSFGIAQPIVPSFNITVGAPIVKGPSVPSGPPPGWKPSITDISNPNVRQPLQLYIGKIPNELDDATLQKVLECCGKVQKWNRPIDATTNTHKSFGMITYEFGINALRCMRVLSDIEIFGAKLQVKAGTKEQAAIDSIIEDEKKQDSEESIKTIENLIKDNMLAILNQPRIVLSTLPTDLSTSVTASLDSNNNDNNTTILIPNSTIPNISDRPDNFAQTEIEKFRLRQAQRDRELEQQRLAKLKEKIQNLQKKKSEGEKQEIAESNSSKKSSNRSSHDTSSAPSIRVGSSSVDYIDNLLDAERMKFDADSRANGGFLSISSKDTVTNNRRERENDTLDPEQEEAKRRRKQQVLEMLGADFDMPPPVTNSSNDKSVKVKIGATNVTTQPKKTSRFGTVDEEDDTKKPVRTLIPIQYTDEERKDESVYRHESHYDEDAEDLHGKIKRYATNSENQSNSAKQAQSIAAQIAAAKAAEIAAAKLKTANTTTKLSEEEQHKLRQKQLVDQIPTSMKELFAYKIDWQKIKDLSIVHSVMKPWITKKVVEYLGEEEETLITFILGKLDGCCKPNDLLVELTAVLDEDAEQFVIKLWRMLIFSMIRN